MIPRTAAAIARARRTNQQAERRGYRVRPPFDGAAR